MKWLRPKTAAYALISSLLICGPPDNTLGGAQPDSVQRPPLVPLAYIRSLLVMPPALALPPDAPIPPRPVAPDKLGLAAWEKQRIGRQQLDLLRTQSVRVLGNTLQQRLSLLPGIALVPGIMVNPTGDLFKNGSLTSDAAIQLGQAAAEAHADAVLLVSVSRFGTRTGIERLIWLQVKTLLIPADGSPIRGPYYSTGFAGTLRKLMGKGNMKTDSDLVTEAIAKTTRELVHTLDTGEEMPFARSCRVAVLPASIPAAVEKQIDGSRGGVSLSTDSLSRISDVLFQPELGPVAERVDDDLVKNAMEGQPMEVGAVFAGTTSTAERALRTIAQSLKVEYLFVSRIADIDYSEREIGARDGGIPRKGVERHVEIEAHGALIRASDLHILWIDRVRGSTVARTEYVRHQPRIRRDDQCIADAARAAYGFLRYGLEEYKRRFER